MNQPISREELYRKAKIIAERRFQSPAQAWPKLGQDFTVVEEDGPAGSLLFSCHMDRSMVNPMGIVHGGITASLVDTCMGVTCSAQCGSIACPTISMTVNYARPVPPDVDVWVLVQTIWVGGTSGQMSAELFLPEKAEEPLVTATGVYSTKRPRP